MTLQTADITGEVRGEKITVRCECTMCNRCGFQVLSQEQSNHYTVASADAYREKHGLLTSTELKGTRQRLKLSQQGFAAFLKVGVASVKRWEAGLIQDEALDQLIRLRTDLSAARNNVRDLEARREMTGLPQTPPLFVATYFLQPEFPVWTSEPLSIARVVTAIGTEQGLCPAA